MPAPDPAPSPADDEVTAALEEIKGRHAARKQYSLGFDPVDAARLLAAVEAVLKEHRRDHHKTPFCEECGHVWPCSTYRAITAALTGKEHGHD